MGNTSFPCIKNCNYGYFDEILIDNIYISDTQIDSFEFQKSVGHKYKNLIKTIYQVEELFLKLMDMNFHKRQVLQKYNSLTILFEKIHCNVCYLDIAQRWVYQQDSNKLYKCCIELEARIAEQDYSLQKKYMKFCDFAKINCFKFEKVPMKNIQSFVNYPGLQTSKSLTRKCPKCFETKTLSDKQAEVSKMPYFIGLFKTL